MRSEALGRKRRSQASPAVLDPLAGHAMGETVIKVGGRLADAMVIVAYTYLRCPQSG